MIIDVLNRTSPWEFHPSSKMCFEVHKPLEFIFKTGSLKPGIIVLIRKVSLPSREMFSSPDILKPESPLNHLLRIMSLYRLRILALEILKKRNLRNKM
jgi:hypothetical protein